MRLQLVLRLIILPAGSQKKTEVDYVKDRFVKKPNGAKPGYVIYHTNYSMTVPPMIPDNVRIKKD